MHQHQDLITVATHGRRLYDITGEVQTCLAASGMATGLMTIFCRHTSASLLIQEHADADVQRDLIRYFDRLVQDGDSLFIHTTEGPDDMPAPIKSALTQTSLNIPVMAGRLALGTWQGIYLFEHRLAPHTRSLVVHAIGS